MSDEGWQVNMGWHVIERQRSPLQPSPKKDLSVYIYPTRAVCPKWNFSLEQFFSRIISKFSWAIQIGLKTYNNQKGFECLVGGICNHCWTFDHNIYSIGWNVPFSTNRISFNMLYTDVSVSACSNPKISFPKIFPMIKILNPRQSEIALTIQWTKWLKN